MPVNNDAKDFRHVEAKFRRETLVMAAIDMVGYTKLSMSQMRDAVQFFQNQVNDVCEGKYHWAERNQSQDESKRNDLLILPTGDGAILCFDHSFRDNQVLKDLISIHNSVLTKYEIYMGISKGEVYIIQDLNERVNVVGWGINEAQRACFAAQPNQIFCTASFAEPYVKTYDSPHFKKLNWRRIKKIPYQFYQIEL